MFSRVLIANRGEVAVRVIRALHELEIEAVAVYSTADKDALHVRLADRAVCIGPPLPARSYLRIPSVVAAAEAESGFGDPTLYLEKAIHPARHVEIQVLADAENVLTMGERECSIQRRHQKLIEESPSAALNPETRESMEAAVDQACRKLGYTNAGTFEFLLGPDRSFYFIEVNTRLQVEHPVTEMVTGIDIVRRQIEIAAGRPLEPVGRAPRRGHAIEI